ncbi:LuxR C-terminal-related transcriptional regulator, partial [Aeromicrobium sp.]|uniref:helix-turn-helix transcriptional regulator n=1 Tax=Aeromicrobium sp. TaxID=1871063 RepID=UPI003D6BDC7A
GQLALLEALQGDLHRATRRATHTLRNAGHAWQAGAMHACVAMAWVHMERGEQVPARHYLDLVATEPGGAREPWLTTCVLLAEARLLMDGGQPEAASRLLVGAGTTETATGRHGSPRLADLRSIALAEALLAVGEPQRALAMITPGPANALVEAATLTAAARSDIGDLRGARAALATVASDLAGSPLDLQIQSWLIEARLAQSDGDAARARLLVDRALRAGDMEDLRRPFIQQWHWLQGFIDRDASLMQDHHAFLRSVQTRRVPHPTTSMEALRSGQPVVGTLTERESQVLALLAQMCTTDEIAAALFVSVNTVKTHLKGIFGKFGVNRRADAVRRGLELGLC